MKEYRWLIIVLIVVIGIGAAFLPKALDLNDAYSQFGSLLSGTLGVGAGIGAMIFLYFTLRDQQKINLQNQTYNLVETFDNRLEKLEEILDEETIWDRHPNEMLSESASESQLPQQSRRKHLEAFFKSEQDGAELGKRWDSFSSTKVFNDSSVEDWKTLVGIASSTDLVRVAFRFLRLQKLLEEIKNIDEKSHRLVRDEWKSLYEPYAVVIAFFEGWSNQKNPQTKENLKHWRKKYGSLTKDLLSRTEFPALKIERTSAEPYGIDSDSLGKAEISISSYVPFEICVERVRVIFEENLEDEKPKTVERDYEMYPLKIKKTEKNPLKIPLSKLLQQSSIIHLYDTVRPKETAIMEFKLRYLPGEFWTYRVKVRFERYEPGEYFTMFEAIDEDD